MAIILSIGTDTKRYCASFGGTTTRNDTATTKRKDAIAPVACAAPAPPIRVRSVSFSGDGFHRLTSDDPMTVFDAPHWQDNSEPLNGDADDASDRKFAVSFTRDTKMKVAATITLPAAPPDPMAVQVRADGPGTVDIAATAAGVAGNDVTLAVTEATNAFANTVAAHDPFTLTWEVSLDNGMTWKPAGATANQVYATWKNPEQADPIHTLIDVGCKAANGVGGVNGMDDDDVLDALWVKLQTRDVHRASDNKVLTYYGFRDENGNGMYDPMVDTDFNSPGTCANTTSALLIQERNGQCFSWAQFMHEILRAQGLSSINGTATVRVNIVNKAPFEFFAINTWATNGMTPYTIVSLDDGVVGENPDPMLAADEAADALGAPGQGTSPNPPSNFGSHFITKANGLFYDPSYGLGPYGDRKDYEEDAFRGGIDEVVAGTTYTLNDPPGDNGMVNDGVDEINMYAEVPF